MFYLASLIAQEAVLKSSSWRMLLTTLKLLAVPMRQDGPLAHGRLQQWVQTSKSTLFTLGPTVFLQSPATWINLPH